ncbi:EscR/YscR/HrcR family type III secretion system export apparatus protein [bacterium]|nr:EscR/YscR/HrcR family type III secretion system export apparatus protein [bacterium]
MTFYSMGGVFQNMWEAGYEPYKKSGSMVEALVEGSKPLKEFMLKNTRESDMAYFLEKSRGKAPEKPEDITIWEVAPAFILSELKTAFEIGFIIYIPFIVLDMVVANVLLALGMFMLSPTIISLPFKLLIFIAVDGWSLVVHGLAGSYN